MLPHKPTSSLIPIHSQMLFSPHINNIVYGAVKSLNFVRQNLNNCNECVKATAYLRLVSTKLECASAVWDPHLTKDTNTIKENKE